jgi:hypothetical protein
VAMEKLTEYHFQMLNIFAKVEMLNLTVEKT